MRKKPNLNSRMEKCAHLLIENPNNLRGKWKDEYKYDKVYLELGCGKGKFASDCAKISPDVLFIALEKSTNVIVTGMERANFENIKNLRFINALADNTGEYFANGEIDRIYINFCDPWEADRYAKRRLTHKKYLEVYESILRPSGELHFKTDNKSLFEFSAQELESSKFIISSTDTDLHKNGTVGIMTEYETKFHEQGKPIYMIIAKTP